MFRFHRFKSKWMFCNFPQEIQQFQATAKTYLLIAFHTQRSLHGSVLTGINSNGYRGQHAWLK